MLELSEEKYLCFNVYFIFYFSEFECVRLEWTIGQLGCMVYVTSRGGILCLHIGFELCRSKYYYKTNTIYVSS